MIDATDNEISCERTFGGDEFVELVLKRGYVVY